VPPDARASTVLKASVTLTEGRAAPRSPFAMVNDTSVGTPIATYGTPEMVSYVVPPAADTVLITALPAATAVVGFVSAVTVQTIAAFIVVAAASVTWRPLVDEKVVPDTDTAAPPFVQVAVGVPPNNGRPVTEIKAMLLVVSIPVKLTVAVEAADSTLLLNAMEAA